MSESKPVLLWADDDEPRRFRHEKRQIEKSGWKVEWANDAQQSSRKLIRRPYQALLLDQMFPYRKSVQNGVLSPWGGCLLLYWLRGCAPPGNAPDLPGFRNLKGKNPLPENVEIPVMVVSAYYESHVRDTMMNASKQDLSLPFAPKPVNIQELLRFLIKLSGA